MTNIAQSFEEVDVYDDGHLRIEHDNYYVACEGNSIKMPRSQFLIISRLARSPQRIVSSTELWKHAWGDSKPFNAVSLHVYMYRLRQKLVPFDLNIETMVNVGYRLMPKARIEDGRTRGGITPIQVREARVAKLK